MPIYSADQIYHFARVAGFSPDQAVTMTAIALSESGGDSHAHNPHGEDSRGLWQVNLRAHASWAAGLDLYDPQDNARAAFEVSRHGADISPWTVTHGGEDARYLQYREEAQAAAVAGGDPSHLGVWTGTVGYGHPVAAGPGDPLGHDPLLHDHALDPLGGGDPAALHTFLDAALDQAGDPYVFGAHAGLDDPNPDAFDCSELTRWAAHQAGVNLPDGSWQQYLELERQGATVPVEQAIRTPGALLFSFSSEPEPGSGRPAEAHVAISLGDGHTIEARGRSYGVGSFDATTSRFHYAAVIPGISGGGDEAGGTAPLVAGADSDHDGLGDTLEVSLGLDPRSVDTDHDSLSDSYELAYLHTDPVAADSDHDGIGDSVEVALGTDPTTPDVDREGRLDDALHRILDNHAGGVDTDGDGLTDSGFVHTVDLDPTDPLGAGHGQGDPAASLFDTGHDVHAEPLHDHFDDNG